MSSTNPQANFDPNIFNFLAQGTLYPDVVESSSAKGSKSQVIKSHHNVGGLPEDLQFELVEPLRDLFKDEAREVGSRLGIPDSIIDRHPFPGPGLGIRIIGEITKEKLDILRLADKIFIEELKNTPTDEETINQKTLAKNSKFWSDLVTASQGRQINIHCLIQNAKGELFAQHRISTRAVFPNIWETSVFGKVESGEHIRDAIAREIFEETSWELDKICLYMGYSDWEMNDKMVKNPIDYQPQRTFSFLVKVNGDLNNPNLEPTKADESKWITELDLDLFEANEIMEDKITPKMVGQYFSDKLFLKSKKTTLYHEVWQAFCVLTDVKSVGVMGDGRTYERLLGIRAVTAVDGMTADWARLPYEFLAKVSNRLINEVRGINRIVYDISSKPPATIEWE